MHAAPLLIQAVADRPCRIAQRQIGQHRIGRLRLGGEMEDGQGGDQRRIRRQQGARHLIDQRRIQAFRLQVAAQPAVGQGRAAGVFETVQAQGDGLKQVDFGVAEAAGRGHAQVGHRRQPQVFRASDGGCEGVGRKLLVQLDPVGAFSGQGVDGGDGLLGRRGDEQFYSIQRGTVGGACGRGRVRRRLGIEAFDDAVLAVQHRPGPDQSCVRRGQVVQGAGHLRCGVGRPHRGHARSQEPAVVVRTRVDVQVDQAGDDAAVAGVDDGGAGRRRAVGRAADTGDDAVHGHHPPSDDRRRARAVDDPA
ncbi:hypothetical protein [Brevundimonas sp. ZS04]|uniref:hypothetical protein n=1 Tax=Brevundimonas sp. ZS04 TaxID=1906854 RepID=UPI00117758A2